jgi:hypothetical protein
MAKNPYADSESLAELLWETEMVADRYSNGGLILIRTKDGWRAFLGNFKDDISQEVEKSLDKNVPSYEKTFTEMSRMLNLIDELHRLLPDCMCFEDYKPMKFTDDLIEDE